MRKITSAAPVFAIFLSLAAPSVAGEPPALEARKLLLEKRTDEALEKLAVAEAELHNLRGSCLVEKRQLAEAKDSFLKAAALQPDNVAIRFNLAEIEFVLDRWQDAERLFSELRPKLPDGNGELAGLVDLKTMICRQKQGLAEEVLPVRQVPSPFDHYSAAVAGFGKGDKIAAEAQLADARAIYDAKTLAPWNDTLSEAGYLEKK